MSLRYRTSPPLGSRRRLVGRILPCFLLVLTQPKALTDLDTIALPPSDAPWDEHIIPPIQSVVEPQSVSARLSGTEVLLTLAYLQDPPCSTAAAAPTPAELAWLLGPGQFADLPPYLDSAGTVGPML